MTAYDWLALLIVFVCLLLSAFFSGSETALTASSRATMLRLEKHGSLQAAQKPPIQCYFAKPCAHVSVRMHASPRRPRSGKREGRIFGKLDRSNG